MGEVNNKMVNREGDGVNKDKERERESERKRVGSQQGRQ